MARNQPRCDRLLESCASSDDDPLVCIAALNFCRATSVYAIFDTGLNLYDIRRPCEGAMCYTIIDAASVYMNKPEVQKELGIVSGFEFKQCNADISRDFIAAGDQNRPSAHIVGSLLDHGVSVLVYAGNQDWFCNSAGMRSVVNALAWEGQSAFHGQEELEWRVDGKASGSMKVWQKLAFVEIYEASHMVPLDKGRGSSVLLNSWIGGTLG